MVHMWFAHVLQKVQCRNDTRIAELQVQSCKLLARRSAWPRARAASTMPLKASNIQPHATSPSPCHTA